VLIIFLAPWLAIATILGLLARPVVRRWQSAGLAPMGEDA
jgi:hypothetical protein